MKSVLKNINAKEMSKAVFIFLMGSIVVFLSHCNRDRSEKICECIKDGVQVSIKEIPEEQRQALCSQLGGQLQNCP